MASNDLAQLVDRLMRRIHMGLTARAADFDTERVGPGGGMILLAIADLGQPSMGALARDLARDKSQLTRAIAGLEGKGLVQRFASETDARVTEIGLTEFGRSVVEGLRGGVADSLAAALPGLSPGEQAKLEELLRKGLS